jgi:hypothetical protein
MQLLSWLHQRITGRPQTRRAPARRPTPRFRPQVRTLEDRVLPSFSAPVSYPVTQPLAVVAADVNHDGKPDLITLAGNGSYVSVQLNNGKGAFGPARMFSDPAGQIAAAMAVGDVNGDGRPDIVFANTNPGGGLVEGQEYIGNVTVLLGDGHGNFTPAPIIVGGGTAAEVIFPGPATSIALADVDGDGKPDLVAVPAGGGWVYVAHSEGGGVFDNAQTYAVPGGVPLQAVVHVAVGDFNGDGKPDIVVADPRLSSVSVLLNNGNGTFGTAQTFAVGGDPAAVAVGDVSGDGKPDIVTANTNGTVSVLVGLGNGTFGAPQSYTVSGPANSVALGDFNHDGHLDIATTGGTETDVLLNNGSGAFEVYQKVGPAGSSVVAADFNGDGYPDLALIDGSGTAVDVLFNNADWMPGPDALSFGSITFNSKTNLYSETVTLTNNTGSTLTGPLSLELTNLPGGVVLTDATGTTNGNPYIRFLSSGRLKPGASVSLTLTFTAPSLSDITFGTEVVPL